MTQVQGDSSINAATTTQRRPLLLALVIALSLCGCILVLSMGWLTPETLQEQVAESGWQGKVLFVSLVIVMELLWLPRSWALMAGGVLFGPVIGIGLSLISDTASAFICYIIGRKAGRDYVARLVQRHKRAQAIITLLAEKRGGVTVAILRIVPLAHYTLVSYLAGITGVRPRVFLIGNTAGLLPSALLYAAVGSSMLDPTSPAFFISGGIFVVILIVTTIAGHKVLKGVQESTSGASEDPSEQVPREA